jgi:hypothetical protein
MSEFQYYEFRAIDKPLDRKAQAELRNITSRAEITATSLTNVYHFGDFKGNPDRLMEKYFDAFLYYANWGTHRLMLRVPKRLLGLAAVEPYQVDEALEAWETEEHLILHFQSDLEGGDDYGDEPESLAELVPLRNDLMAGDLRCLYLGWLAGVDSYEVAEEEEEPPVPPGLGELSGSLEELASFLRIDQELTAVAAVVSPPRAVSEYSSEDVERWVASLPEVEKNQLLLRAIQGGGAFLGQELTQRFREEQARNRPAVTEEVSARRTAGQLLQARDKLAEERQRKEAERKARERERLAREKAEARSRHLDGLVGQEERLWLQVEEAIATKQPKQYDRAVGWLVDLRDLAQKQSGSDPFLARLRQLRQKHANKRSLIERLDKSGLQ